MKPVRKPFSTTKHQERMDSVPPDSYRDGAKPQGPVACPKCGASYENGRWTWGRPAAEALRLKCPACRRIEDRFPAGYATLSGPFLGQHRDEVLRLVHSREALERREHPMQRIIAVETAGDDVVVTTTDAHLARSIAHALHEAFKGEMNLHIGKDEPLVRATWRR